MLRSDVERNYSVIDGRITNPGQFEGERIYVPHFWDAYLRGFTDRDDGCILGFDVSENDRAEFPELKNRRTVKLYQRDDGFVREY